MLSNDEIDNTLRCPINWNDIIQHRELANWFRFLWINKIRKYGVDNEVFYTQGSDWQYDPDEVLIEEMTDEERVSFGFNLEMWHGKAVTEYLSEFRRFQYLSCCGPEVYSKHYVSSELSDKEVSELSNGSKASLIFPRFTAAKQTQLMWTALDLLVYENIDDFHEFKDEFAEDYWKEIDKRFWLIFGVSAMRVHTKVSEPNSVGATDGVITPYCCIDFDFSTPQFHIYPVSSEEYNKGIFQTDVTNWEAGASGYFDIYEPAG